MIIKVDDQVIVYGYAKEITNYDGPILFSFFNGVQMQVMEVNNQYGFIIVLCREFDFNEGTIRDYFVHGEQCKKIK